MRRVLLHCLVSLGDAIMATSVIPIVRRAWPGVRVAMLVKAANRAVVENNPQVDEALIYDFKSKTPSFTSTWRLWRQMRQNRFDLSISLDRHRRGILLCRLAGLPERVGPAFVFNYSPDRAWSRRLYTRLIEPRLNLDSDSRVEIIKDIVRLYTGQPEADGRPSFGRPAPADFDRARSLLAGLPPGRPVGLCLQGNLPIRAWPQERFARLIDLLAERAEARAFIIGTAAQRGYAEATAALSRNGAANFCGLTSLPQLAALFSLSRAFVTVDTGAAHLAAALNVPQVTIFGSDTPRLYRPLSGTAGGEAVNRHLWSGRPCSPCYYFNPEECPRGLACFYDLTAEDVLAQLRAAWSERQAET